MLSAQLPEAMSQPEQCCDREAQTSSPRSPFASSLLSPLLHTWPGCRPSKAATSRHPSQSCGWAVAVAGACLALVALVACAWPLLSSNLPYLARLTESPSVVLQAWVRLGGQGHAVWATAVSSGEAARQGLLRGLLLWQMVLAGGTRWLLEPLAVVLILDVLLLTLTGLAYQVFTSLFGERPRHSAEATVGPTGESPSKVLEVSHEALPRVLVQLPMYNEREVYARAIACACQLAWPRNRLTIQVLDDSTEEDVSEGMRREVEEWRQKGVDVRYRHREDRKGYKAGNLREGLMEKYAQECKYVAVLDADFEPKADWLMQSVAYLERDRTLALVQTRWTFSNEDECLVTQLQAVELTWHFWAEQLVSSLALKCFGFNGTAGVWRIEAIVDSGNWRDDTTVEDMDMAVCAAMKGWKMLMVPEVECQSEVPASYSAYRKQQHRWTSGPASLLRQRFWSIACTPGHALGWGAKAYFVGVYIVLRRAVRHLVGMVLWPLLVLWLLLPSLCLAIQGWDGPLQLSALPSVAVMPFPWLTVAFALIYPACLFCFSLHRLYLYPAYVLFLNGMLPLRVYAVLAGLLDMKSSRTWDVTQKLGKKNSNLGMLRDLSPQKDANDAGVVVSVDCPGGDGPGSARLAKRAESCSRLSRTSCGWLSTSSSSSSISSISSISSSSIPSMSRCSSASLCSPTGSGAKKHSRSRFEQEIWMGWLLVAAAGMLASWDVVLLSTRHPGEWARMSGALLRVAVVLSLFLQGVWSLYIGGVVASQ